MAALVVVVADRVTTQAQLVLLQLDTALAAACHLTQVKMDNLQHVVALVVLTQVEVAAEDNMVQTVDRVLLLSSINYKTYL
jgi:hypothetical protein